MPRYCLDTSGLSNPLENMPEDIYASLWRQVQSLLEDGVICCNTEILDELSSVGGRVGACISACGPIMCYEVGDDKWAWRDSSSTSSG